MGILKSDDDAKKILEAIGKVQETVQKARREIREGEQATRHHIASEISTVANDTAHTKNFMARLLTAVKKLLNKMGISTDDL